MINTNFYNNWINNHNAIGILNYIDNVFFGNANNELKTAFLYTEQWQKRPMYHKTSVWFCSLNLYQFPNCEYKPILGVTIIFNCNGIFNVIVGFYYYHNIDNQKYLRFTFKRTSLMMGKKKRVVLICKKVPYLTQQFVFPIKKIWNIQYNKKY